MDTLMDVRPSDADHDHGVRSPEGAAPGLGRIGARAQIEVLDRDGQIRQSLTVAVEDFEHSDALGHFFSGP